MKLKTLITTILFFTIGFSNAQVSGLDRPHRSVGVGIWDSVPSSLWQPKNGIYHIDTTTNIMWIHKGGGVYEKLSTGGSQLDTFNIVSQDSILVRVTSLGVELDRDTVRVDLSDYQTISGTANWDKDSSDDFDGDYNSLINKPTIPPNLDNDPTNELFDSTFIYQALIDTSAAIRGDFPTIDPNLDNDPTNEIQDLTITGSGATRSISISGGSSFNIGDTDTQLTEAQVDAFVSNNGYLTTDVDTTYKIQGGNVISVTKTVSGTEVTHNIAVNEADIDLADIDSTGFASYVTPLIPEDIDTSYFQYGETQDTTKNKTPIVEIEGTTYLNGKVLDADGDTALVNQVLGVNPATGEADWRDLGEKELLINFQKKYFNREGTNILLMGDSKIDVPDFFVEQFTRSITKYQKSGGGGWFSLAPVTEGSFYTPMPGYSIAHTGVWTRKRITQNGHGLDGRSITSSEVGATIKITSTPVDGIIDLDENNSIALICNPNGATYRMRAFPTDNWSTFTANATAGLSIHQGRRTVGNQDKEWEIEVLSGTLEIYGCELTHTSRTDRPVIYKAGHGSSFSIQWATLTSNPIWLDQYENVIFPDLVLIQLGTNDLSVSNTATIGANLTTITNNLRSRIPDIEIVFIAPSPRPSAAVGNSSDLTKNIKQAAIDNNVKFINIYELYGGDDYDSGDGLLFDGIHESARGAAYSAAHVTNCITDNFDQSTPMEFGSEDVWLLGGQDLSGGNTIGSTDASTVTFVNNGNATMRTTIDNRVVVGTGADLAGITPKLYVNSIDNVGTGAQPISMFRGQFGKGFKIDEDADRVRLSTFLDGGSEGQKTSLNFGDTSYGRGLSPNAKHEFWVGNSASGIITDGDASQRSHFKIYRQGRTQVVFNLREGSGFPFEIQHKHATVDNTYYPISLQRLGGNVGIGLHNPSSKLEVNGNFEVSGYMQINTTYPINGTGVPNGSIFKGVDGGFYYKSDGGTVTQLATN